MLFATYRSTPCGRAWSSGRRTGHGRACARIGLGKMMRSSPSGPVLERYGDFAAFLGTPADYTEAWAMLRRAETTGRPIGARDWVEQIERQTGRVLAPQKRGPKSRVSCI